MHAKSQHVKAFRKEFIVDISIIGTGNVGSALAGAFVRAGHDVTIAGRDIDKTRQVAAATGATPASTSREAARLATVVVLAIPFGSAEAVAGEIADVVHGKVVIDVSNPMNATYDGLLSDAGPSAAERNPGLAPGRPCRQGVQHRAGLAPGGSHRGR